MAITMLSTLFTLTSMAHATPAELDGKHHVLQFQLVTWAPDLENTGTRGALARIAVGAEVDLRLPPVLQDGHQTAHRVHDDAAKLVVTPVAGITVSTTGGDGLHVRCDRAGTFELAVTTTDGGKPIRDAVDIGCVQATRFVATTSAKRVLAGPSTIDVTFSYLARRPDARQDVELVGDAPVYASPTEAWEARSYTVSQPYAHGARVSVLGGFKSLRLTSLGLVAELPVEVTGGPWTLDLRFVDQQPDRVTVEVRALDDHGQPYDGLTGCLVTSYLDGISTERPMSCRFDVIPAYSGGRPRRRSDFVADRICVDVDGQTVCKRTY